jgi:hypothetical protein
MKKPFQVEGPVGGLDLYQFKLTEEIGYFKGCGLR